jgi:hypothetical protein
MLHLQWQIRVFTSTRNQVYYIYKILANKPSTSSSQGKGGSPAVHYMPLLLGRLDVATACSEAIAGTTRGCFLGHLGDTPSPQLRARTTSQAVAAACCVLQSTLAQQSGYWRETVVEMSTLIAVLLVKDAVSVLCMVPPMQAIPPFPHVRADWPH